MRQRGPVILVLDCEFNAWRRRRCLEQPMILRVSDSAPAILPFTFNDVHPTLAGDARDVVLRPSGGVKS